MSTELIKIILKYKTHSNIKRNQIKSWISDWLMAWGDSKVRIMCQNLFMYYIPPPPPLSSQRTFLKNTGGGPWQLEQKCLIKPFECVSCGATGGALRWYLKRKCSKEECGGRVLSSLYTLRYPTVPVSILLLLLLLLLHPLLSSLYPRYIRYLLTKLFTQTTTFSFTLLSTELREQRTYIYL